MLVDLGVGGMKDGSVRDVWLARFPKTVQVPFTEMERSREELIFGFEIKCFGW